MHFCRKNNKKNAFFAQKVAWMKKKMYLCTLFCMRMCERMTYMRTNMYNKYITKRDR